MWKYLLGGLAVVGGGSFLVNQASVVKRLKVGFNRLLSLKKTGSNLILSLELTVNNPTTSRLNFNSFDVDVFIGNTYVGVSSNQKGGVISPGINPFTVSFACELSDIYNALIGQIKTGFSPVSFRFKGRLVAYTFTLPVDFTVPISIPIL